MIAIDLDGVVLDLNAVFPTFVKEKYGISLERNPPEWSYGLKDNKLIGEMFKAFFDSELPNRFPLVNPEIVDVLNNLKGKYRFVTEFPKQHEYKRVFNLELHKLDSRKLVCTDNKKMFITQTKLFDPIIDDKPSFVEEMSDLGYCMIMPVYNYNKHLIGKKNVLHYFDIESLKKILIQVQGCEI